MEGFARDETLLGARVATTAQSTGIRTPGAMLHAVGAALAYATRSLETEEVDAAYSVAHSVAKVASPWLGAGTALTPADHMTKAATRAEVKTNDARNTELSHARSANDPLDRTT